MDNPWQIIAVTLLLSLIASFLFSGMEAGVLALSPIRIRQRMRAGSRAATLLSAYLRRPERFLWTILVGNTLATFVTLGLLVFVLFRAFRDRPVFALLIFVFCVILFYTLFDLMPKMLFRTYPNRLCLALVRPYRLVHILLQPLVSVFSGLSKIALHWTGGRAYTVRLLGNREELRLLIQEAEETFSRDERRMINRVLDLPSRPLSAIVTPLSKSVTVDTDTPLDEVIALCRRHGFTRLPVWGKLESPRTIVGIVSLKSILYTDPLDLKRTAGAQLTPALHLSQDLNLERALFRMQQGSHRLAIVIDKKRRVKGLASLEDILRFLFGEVRL